MKTLTYHGRTLHRVGISWYDVTGIALETTPSGGRWYPQAAQIATSLAAAKKIIAGRFSVDGVSKNQ